MNPSGIMTIASARRDLWWRGGQARSRAQGLYFDSIILIGDEKNPLIFCVAKFQDCRQLSRHAERVVLASARSPQPPGHRGLDPPRLLPRPGRHPGRRHLPLQVREHHHTI